MKTIRNYYKTAMSNKMAGDINIQTQSPLVRRTMRRVYCVYVVRQMTRPTLVKTYILAALAGRLASGVSVVDVVRNAATSVTLGDHALFYTRALARTDAEVQFIVVGGMVFALWLARDLTLSSGWKANVPKVGRVLLWPLKPIQHLFSSVRRGFASKVVS